MAVVSIRSFAPLMKQRVRIARRESYGDYGAATYSADVTYQCAVIGEMRMVRNAAGVEVPSSQSVYLMSNAHVTPEDRITLSTQDVGSTETYALQPEILAVGRYPFLCGQFLTVLHLGVGGRRG